MVGSTAVELDTAPGVLEDASVVGGRLVNMLLTTVENVREEGAGAVLDVDGWPLEVLGG